MTNEQKEAIRFMRDGGIGYTKIAKKLSLSENTVKSFCKRHQLGGIAAAQPETNSAVGIFCLNCGKPLVPGIGKKPRKFCSDECRITWWNSHPESVKKKAVYRLTCTGCGKPFESYGNKSRHYCCHACYIADRFGKAGDSQ
jgi:endogenous inhibitor of DNA gyrase (YacG/DUF329 family)